MPKHSNLYVIRKAASDVGGCSFCSNRGDVLVVRSHGSTLEVRLCLDRCAGEMHAETKAGRTNRRPLPT